MRAIERGIQADPVAAHRRLGNFILLALGAGFLAGASIALVVVWLWSV
jgi:hypothetical protein